MGVKLIKGGGRRGGGVQANTNRSVRVVSDTRRSRFANASESPLKIDDGMALREQAIVAARAETLFSQTIAVLVPVLGRPHRVEPLARSFAETASVDVARLYFIAQQSDRDEISAIRDAGYEPIVVPNANRSWARKINIGYRETHERWMLLGADDLQFHAGWIRAIGALLMSHPGVIGTNDLGNSATIRGSHSTHPLVRRTYAKIMGTVDTRDRVLHDGYDHNYPDTELIATARKRDMYIHSRECVIEHLHPAWGKAISDATYERGQKNYQQDSQLFQHRQKAYGWG